MIFLKFLLNYHYDNIMLVTVFFPTPQNLLAPPIPEVYNQFKNCNFCDVKNVTANSICAKRP